MCLNVVSFLWHIMVLLCKHVGLYLFCTFPTIRILGLLDLGVLTVVLETVAQNSYTRVRSYNMIIYYDDTPLLYAFKMY